ncbi:DNA mismatch repair protein MutS [Acetobacter malorum]|uniref:DNA mismatch repair protein MutS n=2 Tax=Acetobacter malorum TaxID=178901 RepID=A0A149V1X7_9PROT|nr:DNA mismatch repair protein MutS [Acetobacter malorum]
MTFMSLLWLDEDQRKGVLPSAVPDCFHDLCLDQVMSAAVGADPDLVSVFCNPPHEIETVVYRQEMFQDLERGDIAACGREFMLALRRSRTLADNARRSGNIWASRRWNLDAARAYAATLETLHGTLTKADPSSRAMKSLIDWLATTLASTRYQRLVREGDEIVEALNRVSYMVRVGEGVFTVLPSDQGLDYGRRIEATFARFRQGDLQPLTFGYEEDVIFTNVEGKVLDFVATLNPEIFGKLDQYCREFGDYESETVRRLDYEFRFVMAWLDLIARLKTSGLSFCYPLLSESCQEERVTDAFDIALALERAKKKAGPVVSNEFHLQGPERVLLVTGPNQGGKTTFARMIGQLHYLAKLGGPVPGQDVHLFHVDHIFTHFEREENAHDLRSKLEDELVRIHQIITDATSRSLVIMNESFSSTTMNDAIALCATVLNTFLERGLICVCVTFLETLATLSDHVVPMVSDVEKGQEDVRTYRIVRARPDGRVYAMALARKYNVTGDDIRRRLASQVRPRETGL